MRNKTNTTNNIKGDDVEMNNGLKLITITNSENEEIHIDKSVLEMAIENGITIDEIFEINNMTSKEILDSLEKTIEINNMTSKEILEYLEKTNKKMEQYLKDIEEKDNDTLRNSRETLIAEATKQIDKLKATKQTDKPAKIKKADNVLLVVAAFLLGSLSASILYGIINLLF